MDQLGTAVVDVTTLVATCHALKSERFESEPGVERRLRARLRRDIKRGTLAYIDALARTRRGHIDAPALAACRRAAEQPMAQAIAHQDLLGRIMHSEPGSLQGLAAARQDLWRLAHLLSHLHQGVAALRESAPAADARAAADWAARLRRRLRKALVAYARASLRGKPPGGVPIGPARAAALLQIGTRGAAEAGRLASLEAAGAGPHAFIRVGVARALLDLTLDWQGASLLQTA